MSETHHAMKHGTDLVTVPRATLRLLLARCRAGLNPVVSWSEARDRMDREAMQKRGEALKEIEEELEPLLLEP